MALACFFSSFPAFSLDYEGCKDDLDKLRKSARDAHDQTELAYIRDSLDEVESRLKRAKTSCGVTDMCTSLRAKALQHGVQTVQMFCQAATSDSMSVKDCMACAAGER